MPNYMGIFADLTLYFYENEFQNPQIFQQAISLFTEQSTLVLSCLLFNLFDSFVIFY
jgi:hypothetical protein